MGSITISSALTRIGILLCAQSLIFGPSVFAQQPYTAEAGEPAESVPPSPTGRTPVNGVITYTYYAGTSPAGRPLSGPPVNAGTYTVVATFRSADGNYTGGCSCTTFTIQKAAPVINLQHPGGTYTGAPIPATGLALTSRPAAVRAAAAPMEVDENGVPIYPGATRPAAAQRMEVDEAGVPIVGEAPPPPRARTYPPARGYPARAVAPPRMEVDENGVPIASETPAEYPPPQRATYSPAPRAYVRPAAAPRVSDEATVPMMGDVQAEYRAQTQSAPAGEGAEGLPPQRPSAYAVAPAAATSSVPTSRPAAAPAAMVPPAQIDGPAVPIGSEAKPAEVTSLPAAPVNANPPMPAKTTQPVKAVSLAKIPGEPTRIAIQTIEPPTAGSPVGTGTVPVLAPPTVLENSTELFPTERVAGPRVWVNGEYLLWWVKGSPLPMPLVTTSTAPGTNLSGAFGQPGTTVLYGGHDADFGAFSGMRISGGGWIDSEESIGAEASFFFLQNQNSKFSAASDVNGNPPLYLPAFNTTLQGERALIVADPTAGLSGNVNISSTSSLWGAEAAGIVNVLTSNTTSVVLICGLRYLDLAEGLSLSNTTTGGGVTDTLRDGFDTSNQFYGATLGSRMTFEQGPWVVSFTEKVAMGATHEVVRITGGITETGAAAPSPGTFPGGFLAQPTNIGVRTSDPFSIVPEVQLKLGYHIRPTPVTLFVSYDFMYWTNVARPGDQVDRNLNLSQSPIFGTTGGNLVGVASPRPLFNRSDFWAQGVSVGAMVRY